MAVFEEEVTTSSVCSQAGWRSDALGHLPMMRSENGSTQPDRPAFERRVSFLRPHRIDADDFVQGSVSRLRERNGPF